MPGLELATRPRSSLPYRHQAVSDSRVGQRLLVLGALAGIALLDQGFKWWSWRNIPGVCIINYAGDVLTPATVNSLYAGRVSGALLDLVDSGLLIVAVLLLLRHRRSTLVLISGSSIIGGWSSNLLDRLVMHYWTAPGSVRGVVDFIPIGPHYYNVADMFIIAGTPLFILATGGRVLRRLVTNRPSATVGTTVSTRRPRRARTAMLAVVAQGLVTAVVGVGAANFGGVTAPVVSASSSSQLTFVHQPAPVTHDVAAFDTR
jgi:lipoprotein signal peptidase